MICPVCKRATLSDMPHVHHPDPDPLHVEPELVRPTRRDSDPRMAIAWLTAALVILIAAVWLAFAAFVRGADQAQISSAIGGWATWYDAPSAQDAAAGPTLREWLGRDWRGQWVRVSLDGRSVTVRLTDWCACGDRHGQATVIDLDDRAFARLAPLSTGVAVVTVAALPDAPPTDVDVHAVAVAVAETMPVWRLPIVAGLVAFVLLVAWYLVPPKEDDL